MAGLSEQLSALSRSFEDRVAARLEELTRENGALKVRLYDLNTECGQLRAAAQGQAETGALKARVAELEAQVAEKEHANQELLSYCELLVSKVPPEEQ